MSTSNKASDAKGVWPQRHPPERGTRNGKHVVVNSACSCCCCCLHTLGALIGIAVAGNLRAEAVAPTDSPNPPKRLPSIQGMFWRNVLVASLASVILFALFYPGVFSDAVASFVLLVGILGPGWLLAASALSSIEIRVRFDPAIRKEYGRHLGKISLGIFVGSIIGFLVMKATTGF